jgi:hypothetical protein
MEGTMKALTLFLGAALLLPGCVTHTLAELEADPRDSLTVQRTEFPKMFARPSTTVGQMRIDLRECGDRPDGGNTVGRKYRGGLASGGGGQVGAGLADYFTLGVVGDAAISEARSRDAACMQEKDYARGGTP